MGLPLTDQFRRDLGCFLSELKDQALKREMAKEAVRESSNSM